MTAHQQPQRVVFHLDMDAFFVSVEELFDPSLKGRPVVVGGKPGERGVVAAASYAARRYGIRSGMPLQRAYRRCPRAVFIEGRPHLYLEHSQRVRETLKRFSPELDVASIDEAYLDMTGSEGPMAPPMRAAHDLHEAVRKDTGLPCSIGIGSSRLIAKVSSGLAKPNGILHVQSGAEAAFLAPLDIGRIPGVGKVMQGRLRQVGITTCGRAAECGPECLEKRFGKAGAALAGKVLGRDAGAWFSPGFGRSNTPKSVSHETTFTTDTTDPVLIDATLAKLTQLVARRLRELGLWTRTIQVKIRNDRFETRTRSRTLDDPTQFDTVILQTVRSLVSKHRNRRRAVRLLGVHAGSLQPQPNSQAKLFDGGAEVKLTSLLQAVDAARDRYGESAVGLASTLGHGRRERVHDNPSGLAGKFARGDDEAPDRS